MKSHNDDIPDYLLGRTTARLGFDDDLDDLRKVYQALGETEQNPPAEMDAFFYAALSAEKKPPRKIFPLYWATGIAASIALLIGAFLWGRNSISPEIQVIVKREVIPGKERIVYQTKEISVPTTTPISPIIPQTIQPETSPKYMEESSREMVAMSLLKAESAADRLQAIQFLEETDSLTPEVRRSLIRTLRQDTNLNVRIASLEALKKFDSDSTIRYAFIQQLNTTDSPTEQLGLIEALVQAREQGAVNPLRRIFNNTQNDALVRKQARLGISQILL